MATNTDTKPWSSPTLDPNLVDTTPTDLPIAPPVGTPPPAPAPVNEMDQRDALAYIKEVLETYGLGSEADWAWEEIISGKGKEQIFQDLRQRDAYKARFSGMQIRRDNGLAAIS